MKGEMLSRMISLATERHAGQFDKGGRPYILHCLTVMHRLRTDDEELQCIAVGHDLIEDTDIEACNLIEMGFSVRIAGGILDLTKFRDETPDAYRARVKSNPDAIRVKMEDPRHNSDIRRLKGVTDKDIARMVRYHEFYLDLASTLVPQQQTSGSEIPNNCPQNTTQEKT
ncbi:hypothetical protein [Tardiphaga alba]|uniref:hypothetical protein n=1 Tax=Tardiphaga alba TaxID=340268 RepID=UPI001BAA1328|nr:hypothetical protein [Tardiphaga alba]